MKQFSIITDSRLGVVADITEALANADINIETLDAISADRHIIVVLNVDRYDDALEVVRKLGGMTVVTEDAILVKLHNEPGALAKIARRFSDAGIALRSVRFIERNADYGLVAISTNRSEAALALVQDVLVS